MAPISDLTAIVSLENTHISVWVDNFKRDGKIQALYNLFSKLIEKNQLVHTLAMYTHEPKTRPKIRKTLESWHPLLEVFIITSHSHCSLS